MSIHKTVFPLFLFFTVLATQAAEVDIRLPAEKDTNLAPITIDLPSQPLNISLQQLAKTSGLDISFDSGVARNKNAPALKGRMSRQEALRRLLSGSGLEAVMDGDNAVIKPILDKDALNMQLETINVRAKRFYEIGPMPGLGLTKEEIPGNVQSISAKQIKEAHSISMADLLNTQLQSVNVNDYQGNPFQMDVTYRGFTASPQIGTPQGLSVFFDGIRVNEPFGDVVNWDMIPINALAGVDVFPGSNPIFGLNTLGGAFSMKTKDGFNNPGVDAEVLAGAFGRKQFLLSAGANNGTIGGFVAMNLFDEDGWRKNSPSEVNQIFGKLSYRNDKLDLHGSMLYAGNNLVGNGLIPKEMYAQSESSVFTSPDKTKNELLQFQIAGAFQVSDTFSITGQVYNRRSDRTAMGGDVNRDFGGSYATRRPTASEQPVCAFASTNPYGIPDYYVVTFTRWIQITDGGYTSAADAIADGLINPATLNQALPVDYAAGAQQAEANMFHGTNGTFFSGSYNNDDFSQFYSNNLAGTGATWNLLAASGNYYSLPSGSMRYLIPADTINGTCGTTSVNSSTAQIIDGQIQVLDASGNPIRRNGANGLNLSTNTGYIEGTPTAIISNVEINQIVKGGAMQLNFNTDKHKFMVGASLDRATSDYSNSQRLGLLDADRNAYLDPENIGQEYTAATYPINNNDFGGTSKTRSIYMSETFKPAENFNLSFAARYNYTNVMTKMRDRKNTLTVDFSDYLNNYIDYLICSGSGLDTCDTNLLTNPVTNPVVTDSRFYGPYIKEKFTYHKFNPSIGATWSVNDNLNIYANWNQGTRTPSAIELGCAFDDTPTLNPKGSGYRPASLVNGSSCNLPTTLSGDPYLPQVVSRTFEVGTRGNLTQDLQWNASVYRTNLFDDIYFVGYTPTQSFFDTIGRTRRQGLELGVSGKAGKADFRVNYSLTDATFQSNFNIANADNSSVNHNPLLPNPDMEKVKSGNRMPGIPLNNLNASFGYWLTDEWRIGLTMVAHGESFARGNENNQHSPKTVSYQLPLAGGGFRTVTNRYVNDGKTPGYATVNFNTSYNFGKGWIGTLLVNNVLDKEYYSASRLGINPFSPSIDGAIGASGFNYNSNDWNSTSFVAPGAPRAAWITLRYEFIPTK